MSVTTAIRLPEDFEVDPGRNPTSIRREVLRSPLMIVGLAILALLLFMAVFAPLLARKGLGANEADSMLRPSAEHWLGTDDSGRDIFALLVYGARTSLLVAVVGSTLAVFAAILVGVLPALVGGAVDMVANRLVVFLLALPGLPLLVLIAALAGRSMVTTIIVIVTAGIAPIARVLRSQALSLRQRGFISAARGFGGGPLYVLRRHIVPGLGPLVVVELVNWAATAVALESALAFLGLGDPSAASWGLLIDRALAEQAFYLGNTWVWWALPAGIAITLAILSFTFVGIALEPSFNPRWLRSP